MVAFCRKKETPRSKPHSFLPNYPYSLNTHVMAKTICLKSFSRPKPLRTCLSGALSWMDEWLFWRKVSSIKSIFARFCTNPPVSPYICHIKLANAQKHTTRAVSTRYNSFITNKKFHHLEIIWTKMALLYSLQLAHLFPISFRHSDIESEFHIEVT